MPIRSLRLVSVCTVALLAVPDVSYAQETPPPATPATPQAEPAITLAPKDQATPSETFDLNRALVSESGGLTSDQVAKLAVERSHQITSAQALAESARWEAKAQWTNFLPTLSVFGQYKRINDVDNKIDFGDIPLPEDDLPDFTQPLDNWSTGATLRIPASDIFLRIWPAYEGSSTVAEARKIQIEATQSEVALRAREAFYGYARAVAFRAVAEQAFKQAEAQAKQISLFVKAGTAAPVDLMNATARLEGARGSLARAEGTLAVTRTMVATATGLKPSEITGLGETVTTLPQPPTQSPDQLVARAFDQRAELRALRKVAGANDLIESAEKNAAWPQLVLEGNLLYANPNPRYVPPNPEWNYNWDVSATLLWTPNQAVSGYAKGKRAESDLAKARADVLALQDSVRIEVVQAYEDFKAADAAARAAEAGLSAAEEAYRVRLVMYGVGAGVAVDLLDADFLVTQARLQYISAVLDARTALARLDRAAVLTR